MRTINSTILLFFLLQIILFIGCGKKPEMERGSKTIVFLGDSVTFGYGVDSETESFFARIDKIMKSGIYGNVRVINAGVNGDGVNNALQRLSTDVIDHKPDIVVIAFGLNDCQNKSMTTEKFGNNINLMIDVIPKNAEVILATSNTFMETGQPLWRNLNISFSPYMKEIRKIARERKLSLIDVNAAWQNHLRMNPRTIESMYVDPTHPSAKGHSVIYKTYMDVLRKKLIQ